MADVNQSVSVDITDPSVLTEWEAGLYMEQAVWPEPPDEIVSMGTIAEANGWTLWSAILEEDDPDRDTAADHWEWTLEAYFAQCGLNVYGGYETLIYIIKNPDSLDYNLVISHGVIDDEVSRDTFLKEKSISLQFEQIPDLGYKIDELISYEWEGQCYDAGGVVVPFPEVTLSDDGRIYVSEQVYGVLRVSFNVLADVYTVTIPDREDATEEKFVSTVTAFYSVGGENRIAELTVDPPPLAGVDCLGYTLEVGPAEPEVSYYTAFAAYDYCTGEPIPDITVEVGSDEVDPDGVNIASGTHALRVTASGYTPTDEDDLDDNDSFTL